MALTRQTTDPEIMRRFYQGVSAELASGESPEAQMLLGRIESSDDKEAIVRELFEEME
jgi:hypothetical protein